MQRPHATETGQEPMASDLRIGEVRLATDDHLRS